MIDIQTPLVYLTLFFSEEEEYGGFSSHTVYTSEHTHVDLNDIVNHLVSVPPLSYFSSQNFFCLFLLPLHRQLVSVELSLGLLTLSRLHHQTTWCLSTNYPILFHLPLL